MALTRFIGPIAVLACFGVICGQQAPSMPSWLVPFPGTTARILTQPNLLESSYATTAPPAEVIAHYRKLFDSAGLPFQPNSDGIGTAIRATAPECGLLIRIRKHGAGTQVEVSCAASPPVVATAPAAPEPARPSRAATEKSHLRPMEEYDRPVYPRPRKPLPPLAWPAWLVHCDGGSLEIHKGVDRFKVSYLKAEFTSQSDRAAIQSFYVSLLNSHDYPVWIESSRITPRDRQAVVEGAHYFDGQPGPRFAIRAELTPVDGAIRVELRITAHR